MEPKGMSKQMIGFQKQVLDSWHEAAVLAEDQTAVSVKWMLDTATWMPEQGRQAVEQWLLVCKEERGRFKAHLDQGLTIAETLFSAPEAPAPAKPKTKTKTTKKKKEPVNESV